MGRAEDRKRKKYISKKLTQKQFEILKSDINREFIEKEVSERCKYFKELFSDSLVEAFLKNNLPKSKVMMILDDTDLIMKRKVEERRNGQS